MQLNRNPFYIYFRIRISYVSLRSLVSFFSFSLNSRYTGCGTEIDLSVWFKCNSFDFERILQSAKSLKAADAVFEFVAVDVASENGLRSGQCHLLHVLMLRSDGKAIHVHGNRHHNFIRTRTTAAGRTAHAMRRQPGFHTFPFGPTILEPNFYLQFRKRISSCSLVLNEALNAKAIRCIT